VTLPTFLIVGAEKCGTTALQVQLSQHPQVFMSNPKEPSYFLSFDPLYVSQKMGGLTHEYVHTAAEYEALFDGSEDKLARGEASPCYLYSEVAPGKIRELLPDAKILIILREPADRAYSQFVFNQQRGWEPRDRSFREALDREQQRVAENEMWAFHYTRRGRYYAQVKRYLDLFGSDQVRVWLYDDLNADPQKVLGEIHDFLGVERVALADPGKRENVTGLPRSALLQQLTQRPNGLKSLAKKLIPERGRKAVMRRLRAWNSVKPPPDYDQLAQLLLRFEDDIEQLAGLIRPDPRVWLHAGHLRSSPIP